MTKRIWLYRALIATASLLIVAACSLGPSLGRFEGLEARIHSYYEQEKQNQWQAAYMYRTASFRQSVPLETYVASMRKDNTGWELRKFEIVSAEERNGKVYVKIRFDELGPSTILPKGARKSPESEKAATPIRIETLEDTVWARDGDTWYSISAGVRSHLSLNAPLTD
jgi:hypothetical protein